MRKRAASPRDVRGSLGFFLLANALPLGAIVVFVVLRQRGEIEIRPLSEQGVSLVAVLAGALVGIVALGWGAYPALRWALDASGVRLRATRERASAGGLGTKLLLAPLMAGLGLVRLFLWCDVALVGLCVVGLVGAEVYALIALATHLRN